MGSTGPLIPAFLVNEGRLCQTETPLATSPCRPIDSRQGKSHGYPAMKWVYIVFGFLGGLIPAAFIYFRLSTSPNYTGAELDPVLALRGLSLGIFAVPVFVLVGLSVAALVHLSSGWIRRRSRGLGSLRDSDAPLAGGSSWVTRTRREQADSAKGEALRSGGSADPRNGS